MSQKLIDYRCTIKELPEDERPREKLIKYGAEKLSDAELLALIIRMGTKERTAVEVSQDILNFFGGLQVLQGISVEELELVKGVGIAKAAQIKAITELSKRIFRAEKNKKVIKNPADAAELLCQI